MNWSKILIGHGFSDLLDSTSSRFPESNCSSIAQIPETPVLEAHAQSAGFEQPTRISAAAQTHKSVAEAISTVMYVRVLLKRAPQVAKNMYDLMILDLHRK